VRRLFALFLVALAGGALVAGLGLWLALARGGQPALAGGELLLTYRIDGELPDHGPEHPFTLPGSDREPSLSSLWTALAAARDDARVVGLALEIRDAAFGLAKAEELRRQIEALAAAGKRVECYLESAGEGGNGTLEYFLASACPTLALAPAGEVALLGLYADSLFLRGTFDKLKVEPSFLSAGRFKSAAEAFTERAHSPAAREALDALLDSFFRQVVDAVAAGRGLDADGVRALIDRGPLSATAALEAGLVDRLAYPDEFESALDDAFEDATRLDLLDYGARHARLRATGERVAVVFAEGTIVRGAGGVEPWGGERYLGSDTLAETLARLERDDDVRAVVLRIDSPGGSALASDLILRRVALLAAEKPVIVSMSDLAASGGYYIATKATRIVAEPGTLTGSIGVVSGKLATGRFQEELLGATHDPLQRGAHADLYSPLVPFDNAQRALLGRRIDEVYGLFLDHVASGRKLERAAVEAVAQGRIWSGEDALARGLVDELGGLDAALAAARAAAGLEPGAGGLDLYPKTPGFWEWLAGSRAPRLSPELAALAARLAATRAPLELELPAELAGLARPF
jgi:protease-4